MININMNKFNDHQLKIGDRRYLSCVDYVEYHGGSFVTIPVIKLLVEKRDGSLAFDRELYRFSISEGSFSDMLNHGGVTVSEISISSIHYNELWKFYDEIMVTAGIDNNLSVTCVDDNDNKISEGFINFGCCRTPQIFKCFDKIVVIDRHRKDLKILVDGVVTDCARMTVSSIYNNKYLNYR